MIRRGYYDLGMPMLYDGGFFVNRSAEEHEMSYKRNPDGWWWRAIK